MDCPDSVQTNLTVTNIDRPPMFRKFPNLEFACLIENTKIEPPQSGIQFDIMSQELTRNNKEYFYLFMSIEMIKIISTAFNSIERG